MLCLAESENDLRERIDRTWSGFAPRSPGHRRATGRDGGDARAATRRVDARTWCRPSRAPRRFVHGGPLRQHRPRLQQRPRDGWRCTSPTGCHRGRLRLRPGRREVLRHQVPLRRSRHGLRWCSWRRWRALKVHGGASPNDLDQARPGAVEPGFPTSPSTSRASGTSANARSSRSTASRWRHRRGDRRRHPWCEEQGVPFAVSPPLRGRRRGSPRPRHGVVDGAGASTHSEPYTPALRAVSDRRGGQDPRRRDGDVRRAGHRVHQSAERDLHRDRDASATRSLPVCIAKTHSSLSDDPKLRGRPHDFEVTVRGIELNAGAGFLVVLTGEILRMPGLPRRPLAADFDLVHGEIVGMR